METKKVAKEYLQKDILRTIFQMWYSFYTTEIGKERKAAIEDMRFKRDGWLYIEPWEIWLELTEHPENEDDRIIWYQNMHGIWKKAEVNDQIIKIPATAFHIEYEQQCWVKYTSPVIWGCRREKERLQEKNDMLTGWKAFAENTGYRVADEY